jgi:hypothetical protein
MAILASRQGPVGAAKAAKAAIRHPHYFRNNFGTTAMANTYARA